MRNQVDTWVKFMTMSMEPQMEAPNDCANGSAHWLSISCITKRMLDEARYNDWLALGWRLAITGCRWISNKPIHIWSRPFCTKIIS